MAQQFGTEVPREEEQECQRESVAQAISGVFAEYRQLATSNTDLRHHQNPGGCEPALVRRSFRVEHEKDAEHDRQKGPQPCEDHLPASR
jgi:hypothetical protein